MLCRCGHWWTDHTEWWDVDEGSGFGCRHCDCSNPEDPDEPEPF